MTNNEQKIILTNISDLDNIILDYKYQLEFCDKYQKVLDSFNDKILSTITNINELFSDMREDGIINQDNSLDRPLKLDCVCNECINVMHENFF